MPHLALLSALALLLSSGLAWAEHIIDAQEALGPNWWGMGVIGLMPLSLAALIVYLVYRASRAHRPPRRK
jgi:hypothetical protein